jgi:hypothetical protein
VAGRSLHRSSGDQLDFPVVKDAGGHHAVELTDVEVVASFSVNCVTRRREISFGFWHKFCSKAVPILAVDIRLGDELAVEQL